MPDALDGLRTALERFRTERDWQRFHTMKNLSMALTGEAAELQELFQWVISVDEERQVLREQRAAIEDEVADVLIQLLNFASIAEIDIVSAAKAKLARNERRYPTERWRGRSEKAPPLGE